MIDDIPTMYAVLSYCRARRIPCYAVYVRPELRDMRFPGVSVELVALTHDTALIRHANGDEESVPAAQIHLRGQDDEPACRGWSCSAK
jgi:hypothetical protein